MLEEMDEPRWQQTMDVNLSGVWKSVKAAVPHIKAGARGGSVILTSSVGGLKAYPHIGHYVTAKHGVVGLMRAFAVELGQHSIRVNSVHPTHAATPLLHNESTFQAFRPDLKNPGKEDMAPICRSFHFFRFPGLKPKTSAMRCDSWHPTNHVMSQVFPSQRCRLLSEVGTASPGRRDITVGGPSAFLAPNFAP
jgi:Enoyl-(Acyl carrier protein) reductase